MRAPRCPYSELQLLNGAFFTGGPEPEGRAVDFLVTQIETEKNVEKRLSRLWLALRELMKKPFTVETEPTVLRHWDTILGLWATAGAWYGLHGHTPLGTLAALNTASKVKERLGAHGFGLNASETAHQGGALASAKYSIGRRLRGHRRDHVLNEALGDLEGSHFSGGPDESGSLLVKGSILLHLDRKKPAIEAFKEALALRESIGSTPEHEIGQAMSELGYALGVHDRTCGLKTTFSARKQGSLQAESESDIDLGLCWTPRASTVIHPRFGPHFPFEEGFDTLSREHPIAADYR